MNMQKYWIDELQEVGKHTPITIIMMHSTEIYDSYCNEDFIFRLIYVYITTMLIYIKLYKLNITIIFFASIS